MTKNKFDSYMAILNDRAHQEEDKPIDLRNAQLSTYEEDEIQDLGEEKPDEAEEEVNEETHEEPVEVTKDIVIVEKAPKDAVNEDVTEEPNDTDDSSNEAEPEEPSFGLTDAFAIIAATLDEDNTEVDFDTIKFAMGYIESKLAEKMNELDPEYSEDLKLLALKLSNYKVEYEKAVSMERRLYMIGMGETRLYRHIEKYGHNDRTLTDMTDIIEDWYNFIEDRTGFDMRENRDIGAILYTLQELKEELPAPKNNTKKKKRRK